MKLALNTTLALVGCLVIVAQARAQDAEPQMDAEMMAKWQEFMTPGENQELLAKKAGKWDLKITMWMQPGAPPTESVGTSEMKMIMGGRYLIDHSEGTFQGMPFEGMGLSAYDNLQKEFKTVWIDNMGTGLILGQGTYDEKSNEMKVNAKGSDPMQGRVANMRSVEKMIDDDHWTNTMYATGPDGKEHKNMEIAYTRAK